MWINYLWRSYNWLDQDRNSGDLAIQYWPEPLCQPLLGARWLHSCTDKPCITWVLVALQPWSRRAHFPTVQTSAGHDPGTGVQAETVGQVVYVNEVPRLGSSTWKWDLGQGKKNLALYPTPGHSSDSEMDSMFPAPEELTNELWQPFIQWLIQQTLPEWVCGNRSSWLFILAIWCKWDAQPGRGQSRRRPGVQPRRPA